MKYMRNYHSFIKESKKQIDKNAIIVEKQVLNEFSSDFWSLCLRSSIFTNEEKSYIESNLTHNKVSLLTEEWEWLGKAIDWVADKGGKLKDFVFNKIKSLRDGIKDFVKGIVNFAKKVFMGLINSAKKAAKALADKQKDATKGQIEKIDKEESGKEFTNLKDTFKWWGIEKPDAEANFASEGFNKISGAIAQSEGEALSSSETNLKEAEQDIEESEKNESISHIIGSTNDDVLMSFYKFSLIKEDKEEEGGEKKEGNEKKGVIAWLLEFLGQEEMDPDAKAGKKLLWWGKLFLKVLATCLNPILKVVEVAVKQFAKNGLALVSFVTSKLGGPGIFKFALLGGITAGLFGLVADSLLLGGVHVPGYEAMSAIKSWIAHALEHGGGFLPGYDAIKYFLKGFCVSMALWHIVEEIKHLVHAEKGHGHGEHKEGEEHGEAKPGAPAKPAEGQAEGKPAAPGAKPAVA